MPDPRGRRRRRAVVGVALVGGISNWARLSDDRLSRGGRGNVHHAKSRPNGSEGGDRPVGPPPWPRRTSASKSDRGPTQTGGGSSHVEVPIPDAIHSLRLLVVRSGRSQKEAEGQTGEVDHSEGPQDDQGTAPDGHGDQGQKAQSSGEPRSAAAGDRRKGGGGEDQIDGARLIKRLTSLMCPDNVRYPVRRKGAIR
jgi:hypothetical protein